MADKHMSRYDRIKQRRQKILDYLSQYGALSTDQTHKLLKDAGVAVNKRTVQRDFEELQVQGLATANPPVGREQTYSLVKTEKPGKEQKQIISPYLLNSLWKEMRRITHIAIYGRADIYPEPEKALGEMRFLIARLPKPLKDKMKPVEKEVIQKIKEAYKKEEEEYSNACYHGVRRLIDELSNLSYELQT